MSSWSRTFHLAVLIGSVFLDAVVLYFPIDAAPRLIMGLLLVPIILWAGLRLEINGMLLNERRWASRCL